MSKEVRDCVAKERGRVFLARSRNSQVFLEMGLEFRGQSKVCPEWCRGSQIMEGL